MVLDIKQIRNQGKTEQSFYFEYAPDTEISGIPYVSVASPIKISGVCYLTGTHTAFIEGEITYTLFGDCSRCLSQAKREYSLAFAETAGDGEESYPVVNDKIDLTKLVEDAVLTDLPIAFLCKDDCEGLKL